MLFSSLLVGSIATAAEWLTTAKIMTTIGTGCLTVASAVEKLKNEYRI